MGRVDLLIIMSEEVRDILVREVMSRKPKVGMPDMTVQQAARTMRSAKVGSLVILEDGRPVGILTERDMVTKIVAEDKAPSKIAVTSIMSSPIITTTPDENVTEAARLMARMKVRRLPVVEDGKLVGMLTENDILKLSPGLIELTREWSKLLGKGEKEKAGMAFSGYCELCGAYSIELKDSEGRMLCAECLEGE
ncbi:MAG: Inosine-5'-monophosphate dehydrogenase [Methanomassiliicoccales archaeon PtaU1.Bin124]|nr:MAG: Inosine-5'-monophosphate dehydrogenase [Methanomassiliicoccales archaeon PtaU1.Bin124]